MSGDPLDHDSLLNARHSAGSPTPAVASPVTSSPPTTPPTASSPRMASRGPIRRYDSTLSNGQPYRRGSSNEFETFDELLRAAGYKETRVMSPEMERQEILEQETQDRRQRQRSFVENYGPLTGRVAHFLSTYIVPAKANSSFLEPTSPAHGLSESPKDDRPPVSFSSSPHDNRRPSRHPDDHANAFSLDSSSSSPSSSSARLTATPKRREPVPQVIPSTPRPIVPSPNRSSRMRPHLRTTASSPHLRLPCVDGPTGPTTRITPATTALRQAQRQSRTRQSSYRTGRLPLPGEDTWLDTFAKAVLGSRASSPNAIRRNSPRKSSSLANRRNTAGSSGTNSWGRKAGSLSGRNSSVNSRGGSRAMYSSNRAADKLLARSHSSGSAIVSTSKTRVLCRSSSTGRHNCGYASDSSRGGTRTPILSPARERDPLWGDAGTSPPVPPLPAAYVAFSTLIPSMRVTRTLRTKMTMTNRSSVTDDEWDYEYEYDDDEVEPHLSNIFVPVSRQQSIQSLRACLDKHAQGTTASYLHPNGRPIRERVRSPLFRNASYGQVIHRQSSGFEEDEDEVDLRGRISTPWSQTSKNRGGKSRGKVIWGWDEDDV